MDVSLKLPPDQGGLELLHVSGTLGFDENGVTLGEITGRIPQADQARFSMSGRYEGYAPDSPFNVEIRLDSMELPDGPSGGGAMA